MSYRDLNAPYLVKSWRRIVNDNISIGRDSALIKQALTTLSCEQILLGMYQQAGNKTISIPQFLARREAWLEEDEFTVSLDLAICINNHVPSAYYIYMDNLEAEGASAFMVCLDAKEKLREWYQGVLG